MAELMTQLIQRLLDLPEWQVLGITVLLLWEAAFVTVFPEEVVMSTLGILWSQGRISFAGALLAIWIGLLPANLFMVWVGRKFGMRVLQHAPFKWFIDPKVVATALAPVKKHGQWVVLATRFTPVIRGPVYFSIGLSGFSPRRFFKFDWLASLVQIPLWILIGRWMGTSADSLLQAFQRVGALFALLLAAGVVFKFVMDRRKARRA